jgi:hypothetical protein
MYYPKSKIKENLYTNGGEYYFPSGDEYIGYYHILFDGKIYTDKSHSPSSILLTNYISNKINVKIDNDIIIYNNIQKNQEILQIQEKIIPKYYYPNPTLKDYNKGIINRYFIKKKTDNNIIEISFEDYNLLKSKSSLYDYNLYTFIELPWKISGNIKDDFTVSPPIYGIYNSNKRIVLDKEKEMNGISKYLNNYTEFS